jgi:hypothetical protein
MKIRGNLAKNLHHNTALEDLLII